MSKRKPHSTTKRRQRIAQTVLRNLAVSFVTGDDFCHVVDTKHGQKVTVSRTLADATGGIAHQWSILIAVFGRDSNGRDYMKSELLQTGARYYQHDLVDFLNRQHTDLIKTMNPNQLIGAGWFASPLGQDWDEQQAFDLFAKLGAFDRERQDSGEIKVIIKETAA